MLKKKLGGTEAITMRENKVGEAQPKEFLNKIQHS